MLTSLPSSSNHDTDLEKLLRSQLFVKDVMSFMGHDLRNQLSVLELASSSLSMEFQNTPNERQQRVLKRIKQATFALKRTAHKYLNISRMVDEEFHPTSLLLDPLKEVIEPLLFLHEDDLLETGQRCQVEIVPSSILCWADLEFLYSIMEDLFENAIRYGDKNGLIRIQIAERGHEHEFSVWNSGPGIDVDDLEIIFEQYVYGTESVSTMGNGIGLYLAKKMVEAHKGRVWADTKPGEWACITFTLPRRAVG